MTKAELIEQLRIAIRRKHYSYATEKTYVVWAGQFFEFSRTCSQLPSEERAGRFLDEMAPRVGGKTQHQALCALAFLFKVLLGHAHIETTAIYLHCVQTFASGVTSPLDLPASNVVPFSLPQLSPPLRQTAAVSR